MAAVALLIACYSPSFDPEMARGSAGTAGVPDVPEPVPGAETPPAAGVAGAGPTGNGFGKSPAATPGNVGPCAPGDPPCRALRLPAACAGVPYSQQLRNPAATPGDVWSLTPPALAGLTLSSDGVLSGVPSVGGGSGARVTRADGTSLALSVEVPLRGSCRIAALEQEGERVRLHYRDIFEGGVDVALPAEPGPNEDAIDFEFSPDGRWLAYRAGLPGQIQLFLQPTTGMADDEPLVWPCGEADVPCSVLDFAWSRGSSSLAVVLHDPTDDSDSLSGLAVEARAEKWALVATDQTLEEPFRYVRGLRWFGEERVGFLGANPLGGNEALYHARLGAAGGGLENLVVMLAAAGEGLRLQDAPPGLLILNPSGATQYLDVSDDGRIDTHAARWLSPSGQFLAQTTDGRLEIFAAADGNIPVATLEQPACGVVIAWSARHAGQESIACSRAQPGSDGQLEPTGEDLMIVDLFVEPSPRLGQAFPVIESDEYTETAIAGVRRLFADSGAWLVVAAPEFNALVIDRAQPAPRPLFRGISIGAGAEARLSPDGATVAVYDDTLRIYPLAGGSAADLSMGSDARRVTTPVDRFGCQESPQLAPELWCGAPAPPAHFVWAPDGEALLFESADGELWLGEARATPSVAARRLSARVAGRTPAGSSRSAYAFQPAAIMEKAR